MSAGWRCNLVKTIRQSLGKAGEQLAAEKLISLGYEIVTRNYRCTAGEIDIVAHHKQVWVFVEVRTRRGTKFGTPEDSITARKQAHMIAAAEVYLDANNLSMVPWRLDLVAVEFSTQGQLLRLDVIPDAVSAN